MNILVLISEIMLPLKRRSLRCVTVLLWNRGLELRSSRPERIDISQVDGQRGYLDLEKTRNLKRFPRVEATSNMFPETIENKYKRNQVAGMLFLSITLGTPQIDVRTWEILK